MITVKWARGWRGVGTRGTGALVLAVAAAACGPAHSADPEPRRQAIVSIPLIERDPPPVWTAPLSTSRPTVIVFTTFPMLRAHDWRPLTQELCEADANVVSVIVGFSEAQTLQDKGHMGSAFEERLDATMRALAGSVDGSRCALLATEQLVAVARRAHETLRSAVVVDVALVEGAAGREGTRAVQIRTDSRPEGSIVAVADGAFDAKVCAVDVLDRSSAGWIGLAGRAQGIADGKTAIAVDGDVREDLDTWRRTGVCVFNDDAGEIYAFVERDRLWVGGWLAASVLNVWAEVRIGEPNASERTPSGLWSRAAFDWFRNRVVSFSVNEQGGPWPPPRGGRGTPGDGLSARSSWSWARTHRDESGRQSIEGVLPFPPGTAPGSVQFRLLRDASARQLASSAGYVAVPAVR